jgi:hypothetical protein
MWVRIPAGTLDSFMWGSYPASLRNVGCSTQVPVRVWNNARNGTWGLPPPVKLERRHMTYTVTVWRKPQLNKQTNKLKSWKDYWFSVNTLISYIISFNEWLISSHWSNLILSVQRIFIIIVNVFFNILYRYWLTVEAKSVNQGVEYELILFLKRFDLQSKFTCL